MSTTPADENPLPADNPDEHEVLDLDSAEADGGQDESAEEGDQSEAVEPSPESQLADARQQLLRGQADLENYQKRSQRELAEQRRYAALPLARELLNVTDNLTRAIEAAVEAGESEQLVSGVQMVAEQLAMILSQYDCLMIDAKGQEFDPNLHEAIGQVPSQDHPPGTVIQVTQAGYRMHDRVVRPSQVLVAVASTGAADEEITDTGGKEEPTE
ncbi:MAG: nucleotide exchange factor GrpE [Planctomycetota bacterium]|nr:nucleotide exchange factor GrpE [Planctomycetota bacterium]